MIEPADPASKATGGIAGFLSGQVGLSGGGVSASGSIGLQVNKSGQAVHESIQLGDKTLKIDFADGSDVFYAVRQRT